MLTQIRHSAKSARGTLLTDTVGAAALVVMLVVGLHLPGFF